MDFLTPIYEFELDAAGTNKGSKRKKALVTVGSPFHLKCSVIGEVHESDPELLIAFNGQFLDNYPLAQYKAESSSVSVIVEHFNESWIGVYECSVKNRSGVRVKSAIYVESKSDASITPRFGEVQCDSSYRNYCENDGICFYQKKLNVYSCRCKTGYSGLQCEYYFPDVIESGTRDRNCDNSTSTLLFGLFGCTLLIFGLICILFYRKNRDLNKRKPKMSDTNVTLSLVPPPSPSCRFASEPTSPKSGSDSISYQPALLRFSIEHNGGSFSGVQPITQQSSFSRTNEEPNSPFPLTAMCCHSACVHSKFSNSANNNQSSGRSDHASTHAHFYSESEMMANEEKLELMKKLSTMSDLSDDRMERGKLISSESMATMVEMRQIGRPPRVRTCSRN